MYGDVGAQSWKRLSRWPRPVWTCQANFDPSLSTTVSCQSGARLGWPCKWRGMRRAASSPMSLRFTGQIPLATNGAIWAVRITGTVTTTRILGRRISNWSRHWKRSLEIEFSSPGVPASLIQRACGIHKIETRSTSYLNGSPILLAFIS